MYISNRYLYQLVCSKVDIHQTLVKDLEGRLLWERGPHLRKEGVKVHTQIIPLREHLM